MNLFQRIQSARRTVSYPNFFLGALGLIAFLKKKKNSSLTATTIFAQIEGDPKC